MKSPEKKPRNGKGERALLIWGLPQTLVKDFHARCLERGVTMKQVLKECMDAYILAGKYPKARARV